MVRQYSAQAHPDTIQAYMLDLAMVKHLKGDETQQAIQLDNAVSGLRGVTELDLYHACKWLKQDWDGEFFPQVATIKKALNEHGVTKFFKNR